MPLINFKKDCQYYLLDVSLPRQPWPKEVKQPFRETLQSHAAYRKTNGNHFDGLNSTWRATWSSSADEGYQVCEQILFSAQNNELLAAAMRKTSRRRKPLLKSHCLSCSPMSTT